MLWDSAAVEIAFDDEETRDNFARAVIDVWSDASIATWDWHGYFHDELADGVGSDLPSPVSVSELLDWVAAAVRGRDGADLSVAPGWEGTRLRFAMSLGVEPAVGPLILTCALVSAAARQGAQCRLLMLGGHDPYNLYGYPDDYTHVIVHQPANTDVSIAHELHEDLMGMVLTGDLDRAFTTAADNPLGDDDF